ncbi:MAG: tRNA (guanosine(46)-N7)-methyltransferase TrmB [Thermoflavifilum sp.]|nr:tRNA (guanosine(46)-N7)-methyltransferase TrmB [Thermoflavifilum sp.]
MAHKKLIRFEEIKHFPNVWSFPQGMAGNWHRYFQNDFPIVLELACGKGEYTLSLVKMYEQLNAIGVDVKGNRIWKGAKAALEQQLTRAAFLRIQIEHLVWYFAPQEISAIWIPFPDPFLKKSKAKKRLTHPRFLWQYQQILKPNGKIHLKTDSPELFDYTLEMIDQIGGRLHVRVDDVPEDASGELGIQTYYERLHRAEGKKIYYLAFSLPEDWKALEPWRQEGLAALEKHLQHLAGIHDPKSISNVE